MSDFKAGKDALVASLFELSRTAQDAAASTLTHFQAAVVDDATGEYLSNLAATVSSLIPEIGSTVAFLGDTTKPMAPVKAPVAKKAEKKKKPEKDPNAPKKPLTIYFAYSFHIRDAIREDRKVKGLPPLSAIEMNEFVKERWAKISDEEKSKWQKKYQDELKEYNKQKEAYTKSKLEGIPLKPTLPSQPKLEPIVAPVEDSDSDSSDDSSSTSSSSSSSSDDDKIVIPVESSKKKEKKRKHSKSDKDKDKKKKSKK